ncbi:hypothetical protein ACFWIQ_33705 [Kitasatospora sp. NPDC127059]|uniref:hypothetical protein n=1 Tax=unclassified Kitasatospora TaxID=2633591 RepID=UPI00365E0995
MQEPPLRLRRRAPLPLLPAEGTEAAEAEATRHRQLTEAAKEHAERTQIAENASFPRTIFGPKSLKISRKEKFRSATCPNEKDEKPDSSEQSISTGRSWAVRDLLVRDRLRGVGGSMGYLAQLDNSSDRYVTVLHQADLSQSKIVKPGDLMMFGLCWFPNDLQDLRLCIQTQKGTFFVSEILGEDKALWEVKGRWEWEDQPGNLAKPTGDKDPFAFYVAKDGDITVRSPVSKR